MCVIRDMGIKYEYMNASVSTWGKRNIWDEGGNCDTLIQMEVYSEYMGLQYIEGFATVYMLYMQGYSMRKVSSIFVTFSLKESSAII